MKYLSFFIIVLLLMSCDSKPIMVSTSQYQKYIGVPRAMVVSTFKCGCVIDFIANFNKTKAAAMGVKIFADSTNITKKEIGNFIHLGQASLDSVFLKNYNIVLFKTTIKGVECKVLKTENSDRFNEITTNFFKE